MKELSIEEKAKRYDEAYKKVAVRFGSNVADEIFLKYSEEERIRKEIISELKYANFKGVYDKHIAWLEKQGNLMKALQISNAKIGELIEENYYLREQLEKQGKNNMGISEATKQKLEDNLNKALEQETPESWNKFLDEQSEQKPVFEMKTPEESLGIDSDTYNKIVDECVYGEQNPIKKHNACEFCEERYECVSPCPMKLIEEEKYTDNVEPKFHEGDWIVHHETENVYQVVTLIDNQYQLKYGDNYTVQKCDDVDRCARLWNITKDAKDGDVLHATGWNSDCIFIFNGLDNWKFDEPNGENAVATGYCCIHVYSNRIEFGSQGPDCIEVDTVRPATRIQSDLLFRHIREANYEWDAEKKELKKVEKKKNIHNKLTAFEFSLKHIIEEAIECGDIRNLKNDADLLLRIARKTSWNEEDEKRISSILLSIEYCKGQYPNLREYQYDIDWLKSLKDRIQPQPKQEWSEEDEEMLNSIIARLHSHPNVDLEEYSKEYDWLNYTLKSLRPKNRLKPSEEQMLAINTAINVLGKGTINGKYLIELQEQLKKLMEK